MPKVPGLVKGLGVTMGRLFRTVKEGADSVQYPHAKESPPIRARATQAVQCGVVCFGDIAALRRLGRRCRDKRALQQVH